MEYIVLRDNTLLYDKEYFDQKEILPYIQEYKKSPIGKILDKSITYSNVFEIPIPVNLFLKIPNEIKILKRGIFENGKIKTGYINNIVLYEGEFENNVLRKGKISKNSYIYYEGEFDKDGKLIKGYQMYKGIKYEKK